MRLVTNRQARCVLLTTDLEIPSTNRSASKEYCTNEPLIEKRMRRLPDSRTTGGG